MLRGTFPDSHARETAWENDVHPGGQMLFLSLSRRPVLLSLLFITLKEDPRRVFTVPRFPSVVHASTPPSPNEQELLLYSWRSENASGFIIYGAWVINHISLQTKLHGVQTYSKCLLWQLHMGSCCNLCNNKNEHSIYFMPYDMYTIVVALDTQAGTYCW